MIHVSNLSVFFGGIALFNQINFRLSKGDRVGLIGKNGAGKSTLLKILSGELTNFEGDLSYPKNTKIGILKQDIDFDEGCTVLEEAYKAFEEIKNLEKQIDDINHSLQTREDYESDAYQELIVQLTELQQQLQMIGGYSYQGTAERVLKGLGFKENEFSKLTNEFSGGWRMRIELAKLLLQNNDIMLLDEPTNHLDIESIIWLEGFLKNYPGCVVIVSHDEMFLDQVTNRTIELSLGRIYDYPKSFSDFKLIRTEIREQQLAAQKNQEKEIAQTEKLIEKFRAKASKASMAQSLIKKLDKVERIEVDQEDNAQMNLKFEVSHQPGKVVFLSESISKRFGKHTVFSDVAFEIERSDKIAFVGQNGQGKSTLAKILVGEHDYQGELSVGHNVQIGYFAQNQAEYLDLNKTVLDTMIDAADAKSRPRVRDILGSFLFRGEEVEKYVKVLSGGERNRLALAKLLLTPFNVLIMDEPTNHLDIQSKEVLKRALINFDGTLIVVSHDRKFLQGLANTVYEFREGKVKEFLGDIDAYLKEREFENMRAVESEQKKNQKSNQQTKQSTNQLSFEQQKKQKSLANQLSKVESKINSTENEIEKLDQQLLKQPELASDAEFFSKYEANQQKLDELMKKWEDIELQLSDG